MPGITQFEDIEAWKTARHLTNAVYAHTNHQGFNRDFGLRDQIRLYIALDQKYITEEQFKETFVIAQTCSRQIANFIKYLESNPRQRRISDETSEYEA